MACRLPALSHVPSARPARGSSCSRLMHTHSLRPRSALPRLRWPPSHFPILQLCLALSGSAVALSFAQSPRRSSEELDESSLGSATASTAFPVRLQPPSQPTAAVDVSAASSARPADSQLVGMGSITLSSDRSAAIALYQPPPHSRQPPSAVLLVRLSCATPSLQLQQALRRVLAPAVEAATGTDWDNIASCSQLDTALASMYVPPPPRPTVSSPPAVFAASSSLDSDYPPQPTLPAGTAMLIELSGPMLRVWLSDRLVCAIQSRMLATAALASLAPLCTPQSARGAQATQGWTDTTCNEHDLQQPAAVAVVCR